mgnify:CR=1 FL=1
MSLRLTPPGSKSMTQRALMIAALADAPSRIHGALVCDDARYLTELLEALGTSVRWDGTTVAVEPAPLCAPEAPVFCGNAGTAVRFGSCLSLLCEGALTIDGDRHMRGRPIGDLGAALEMLGVDVSYLGAAGCPPLRLARRGPAPASVQIDASISSQYASGLLLVSPRLGGLSISLSGELVSRPYLEMTAAMMRRAGVDVVWRDATLTASGSYRGGDIAVEADWSGASFLLAAEAITGVAIDVVGLAPPDSSLQGDAVFVAQLEALAAGADEIDLTDCPDLIAPLVAVALFRDAPLRITGAAHTRVKECDRVAVLCRELGKVGADMTPRDDGLLLRPAHLPAAAAELDPEDDHRMAMAFGVVSLRLPQLRVASPACVSKSYPAFWDDLAAIRDAQS